MHSGSTFVKFMKQKFGAVSVGFSGWAIDRRYRAAMGFDYALPLSDHCDYSELLEVVNLSGAEKIYTFHGFAVEFANSLEKLGFKAEALKGHPKKGRVRYRKPAVNRIDSYF
jgi:putative mRNA 3-end processing factor